MTGAAGSARNHQQLRLALAMRGGASMAVWIGGAVAEIDNLRTAVTSTPAAGRGDHEPEQDHPWSVLARIAGYDSVDVDVLAGTSAGGLNGALLASSVVYGMRFDAMRRTWVRLADLEAMARPVPKLWHPRPPSLLEGDAYFREELARAITDNLPRGRTREVGGSRMDLLLTATLLDPVIESYFDGRSEPITQQRRRATFRFRHRGSPGQPLSDFGAGDQLPVTARRLAQAARTTSSFPLAFEPADVRSSALREDGDEPNMYGLFSEVAPRDGTPQPSTPRAPRRSDPYSFRVIDGGVLDNIPVTAAIHSVADAMADRPTDRWLLYLNPEPASPPEAHARRPRFALPVAGAALQAKMGQETLLADINALDEHNQAVERTRLRRVALLAGTASAPPGERHEALAAQVEAVRDEHAQVRARLNADHVHRLLTESDETDDRPLLEPLGGDPLTAWSPEARTALRDHVIERFAAYARDDPDSMFTGVRGLLSGVQECLVWAQELEVGAPRHELGEIGQSKARLYRLRTFAQVVQAHAQRYWTTGARLEPITQVAELDDWVDRVARRHRLMQHGLPVPLVPILGSVLAAVESDEDVMGEEFQECLAEFSAELASIVGSSGADAAPDSDSARVDAMAEARLVLHRVADRLAANAGTRDSPRNLGHTLLRTADDERRPEVLHQLVVLTAPVDVGRAAGSHIKFLRVVSDARTPLPFLSLRDNGRVATPDKVRGSGLGNFAAFLSAKWRANDWMWGRLDSATSLVPLLIDPGRLLAHGGDLGADGLGDTLERLVSQPTQAELGEVGELEAQRWRDFLAGRWAEYAEDVRGELKALFTRPDAEHPLSATRRAVTERLHWMIAAREMPFVDAVAAGADPTANDVACEADPVHLQHRVRTYSVGRQRWRDLDEQRLSSVATRFALISYRASLPGGYRPLSLLTRLGAALAKPLLMAVTLAVVAPTRAALSAFLAASTVVLSDVNSVFAPVTAGTGESVGMLFVTRCGPGEVLSGVLNCVPGGERVTAARMTPGFGNPQWWGFVDVAGNSPGAAVLVAALLAVVFAGWFGRQVGCWFTRDRGLERLLLAACVGGVLLVTGYWAYSTGFRLGPAGSTAALMLVTWLATFGYRLSGRTLATALTGAVLFAMTWVGSALTLSAGVWLLLGSLVTAYAHMVLLGTVDVLPPRPRPGPEPVAAPRVTAKRRTPA